VIAYSASRRSQKKARFSPGFFVSSANKLPVSPLSGGCLSKAAPQK